MPALKPQHRTVANSSRSSDVANCVEVPITGVAVAARDSKHLAGAILVVSPRAWASFIAAVRR